MHTDCTFRSSQEPWPPQSFGQDDRCKLLGASWTLPLTPAIALQSIYSALERFSFRNLDILDVEPNSRFFALYPWPFRVKLYGSSTPWTTSFMHKVPYLVSCLGKKCLVTGSHCGIHLPMSSTITLSPSVSDRARLNENVEYFARRFSHTVQHLSVSEWYSELETLEL